MKIGFVLDDTFDSTDGVQQYVKTLGAWLSQRGERVHYLAGQSQPAPAVFSLSKNIRMRFNGNRFSIPLSASSHKIRDLLEREKYDVLHVQMPFSPFMAGKVINLAPATTGIVATFHILPYGRLQALGNRLLYHFEKRSLKRIHGFCFVSPAARQFAHKTYHVDGKVIPNLIDLRAWKNNHSIVSGRVVFLGRLVPRKGCQELLLALAALPADLTKHLEIIIAGDGPERSKLEQLSRQLHVNASFYGHVSEAEKKELLSTAEIAIFPSLGGESFGIVLIEAMAAGAGVVLGGDNPGYRAVLGDLPECLIEFRNTKMAAQKLALLIQNKSLQNRLHIQQQQAVKQYDTPTVGHQIMNLYHRALLHRKPDMR